MRLSELVAPDFAVARSINLERDFDDETSLKRYFVTGKSVDIVWRLAEGLNGEKVSAWSLTGPYGMGKSAFVNFLLSLCGPDSDPKTRLARNMLAQREPDLVSRFEEGLKKRRVKGRGFLRVAATASFEPVNRTLSRALLRAVEGSGKEAVAPGELQDLSRELAEMCENDVPDATRLADCFRKASDRFGAPVALAVDEFGKNLEFMARYPATGDLFVLQTLAETRDIFIWVCLHQAFEEYASALTGKQRREWAKVQGRFEDVVFVEPSNQMLRFVGEILSPRTDQGPLADKIAEWGRFYREEGVRRGLSEIQDLGEKDISSFYPLHPLAAVFLPELCSRFAQNDRTLFAFLCGGEPRALPAFLKSNKIDPQSGRLPVFGPDLLYDYFISSANGISMVRPEASRWIEIREMVERAERFSKMDRKLLKTVGLMNLVSGPRGLAASADRIAFALAGPDSAPDQAGEISRALAKLSRKGMLIYREYADEYRLWEGSDFDVREAVAKQRAIAGTLPLLHILENNAPLTPLTASRHSYQYGTQRHFQRRWADEDSLADEKTFAVSPFADGLVLYAFGTDSPDTPFPDRTPDGKPVLVAHSPNEEQIRDMAMEAAAAKAVLESSPELTRDGVARREAGFRARAAEDQLDGRLRDLFAPGAPELRWLHGERTFLLHSDRHLSETLSHLCDRFYSQCPVIRNELINRAALTSAAAKARRELVEAMLNNESKENLGMAGFGPEVAIYRTMLLAEGLHLQGPCGVWSFVPPPEDSGYFPAWKKMSDLIEISDGNPLSVADLIDALKLPPFGLKDGPIPILVVLYLLVGADELAVYQEGVFVPFLAEPELELMAKRPELFSVKRFAPVGVRGKIFRVYQELLNTCPAAAGERIRNATMVGIVGPMVQFADKLPPYVKSTKSLSREARKLLRALLGAKDPIALLFEDLPRAVGLEPFEARKAVGRERKRKRERERESVCVCVCVKEFQVLLVSLLFRSIT